MYFPPVPVNDSVENDDEIVFEFSPSSTPLVAQEVQEAQEEDDEIVFQFSPSSTPHGVQELQLPSLPDNFSELYIPSPAIGFPPTPLPPLPTTNSTNRQLSFSQGMSQPTLGTTFPAPVPISPTLQDKSSFVAFNQSTYHSNLSQTNNPSEHRHSVSNREAVFMPSPAPRKVLGKGIQPFRGQMAPPANEIDLSPAPVVRPSIRHNLYRAESSSEDEGNNAASEEKAVDHLPEILNQWVTSAQTTPKRASTTPSRSRALETARTLANYLDLSKPLDSLEHWGIPAELAAAYQKHAGVSSLYAWQAECVNQPTVLAGGNLVYSAPTSGGKTLVAEILMVRRLLYERQSRVRLLRQNATHTTKINEGPGSGGKALFVLPYVSIVTEKGRYFNKIFGGKKTSWPNRIRVQTFYSQSGGSVIPKNVDIAICTIEKANVLINHMMEEGTFSQLVCVVIDEMHMMGEQDRGYLLELLISKIRFKIAWEKAEQTAKAQHNILLSPPVLRGAASPLLREEAALIPSQFPHTPSQQEATIPGTETNAVQLVGLSATLSNADDLCKWLEAALYVTHFRPVPLTEYYKIGNTLFGKNLEPAREIENMLPANFMAPIKHPNVERKVQALIQKFKFQTNMAAQELKKLDTDQIVQLTWEIVSQDKSVLVFCASRDSCEKVCLLLAQGLPLARVVTNGRKILQEISHEVHGVPKYASFDPAQAEIALQLPEADSKQQQARAKMIQRLTNTPFGLDHTLSKCVPQGIAYHHAGMTIEERDLIETAFRKGNLRVLCATSTLAAGVNLPGKRVIFRSARVGIADLDPIKYRQMSGRAGRAGKDDTGESILVIPSQDNQNKGRALAESLMVAPLPSLQSCLTGHPGGIGMTRIMLEAVAAGIVTTTDQIQLFITCTLYYVQFPVADVHETARDALRYLTQNEFIVWHNAQQQYQATKLGKATFASSLAPPAALVVYQGLAKGMKELVLEGDLHLLYLLAPVTHVEPIWNQFLDVYERLDSNLKHAAQLIGADMGYVVKCITKAPTGEDSKLIRHRRLWVAFILLDLINEVPVNTVALKYGLNRGVVQNLQKEASQFAGMVTVFCKRLNYTFFEMLASEYCDRLQFGVSGELVPLMGLAPNLPPTVVRALFSAGFVTVETIAEANPAELVRIIRNSTPFHSAADENGPQPNIQAIQAKEMRLAHVLCRGAQKTLRARGQEQAKACATMDMALAPIKEDGEEGQNGNASEALPALPPILNTPVNVPAAKRQKVAEQKISLGGAANGPNMINVGLSIQTFEKFVEEWGKIPVFAWAIYGVKVPHDAPFVGKHCPQEYVKYIMPGELEALMIAREDLGGMVVTWNFETVYNIPLAKDTMDDEEDNDAVPPELAWESIYDMLANPQSTKVTFDMKTQLKLLHIAGCPKVKGHLQDPRIAHWLINPEEKRLLTVKHFYRHYVTNNSKLAKNLVASPGAGSEERSTLAQDAEHAGRQVFQCFWVMSKLKQILANQKLLHAFETVEMPLVPVLADMELVGMGFDKTGYCHHNFEVISKIQALELIAHELAGREFNLTSTLEVSEVLFRDLGLEPPPQARSKKSNKLLVGAIVLEHLSRQPNAHPLPAVIQEHRKLNHFLCKYVASLPRAAVHSPRFNMNRVHGTIIQTHTATGRLCVITPNLQSVSKEVVFTPARRHSVQEEIEDGVLRSVDGQVKYCGKSSVPTANSMQVLVVSTTNSVGFSSGTLVAITTATVGDCYSQREESLAEFWAKKGHPYEPGRLGVVQVKVEIRQDDRVVIYTYPADKVWRCAAYVVGEIYSHPSNQPSKKTESRVFSRVPSDPEVINPWQKEVKFSVRAAFVAAPRFVLLSADYSQIELRLLAHFSQDATLIKQLREAGGDVFQVIGSSLYQIPQEQVSKEQRNHAKKIVYGLLYGAGSKLLAHELDMPVETCQHFVETFRRAYPALPHYLSEVIADCRKRGYVVTLSGRRRYLPQIYSSVPKDRAAAERQAFNTIAQGSAADLIKQAMVRIDDRLAKFEDEEQTRNSARLIMQIHDELLYEVREDCLDAVQEIIREGMQSCVKISVPLLVRMSVGKDWANLSVSNGPAAVCKPEEKTP